MMMMFHVSFQDSLFTSENRYLNSTTFLSNHFEFFFSFSLEDQIDFALTGTYGEVHKERLQKMTPTPATKWLCKNAAKTHSFMIINSHNHNYYSYENLVMISQRKVPRQRAIFLCSYISFPFLRCPIR